MWLSASVIIISHASPPSLRRWLFGFIPALNIFCIANLYASMAFAFDPLCCLTRSHAFDISNSPLSPYIFAISCLNLPNSLNWSLSTPASKLSSTSSSTPYSSLMSLKSMLSKSILFTSGSPS